MELDDYAFFFLIYSKNIYVDKDLQGKGFLKKKKNNGSKTAVLLAVINLTDYLEKKKTK